MQLTEMNKPFLAAMQDAERIDPAFGDVGQQWHDSDRTYCMGGEL